MTILLLVLAMIFNLLAQSLLKLAVTDFRFEGFKFVALYKLFSNPYIWIGAIIYGASFLFYILALSRGELSKISPVSQALTTIGIVTISIFIFNEHLTLLKGVGLLLLLIATIIIYI